MVPPGSKPGFWGGWGVGGGSHIYIYIYMHIYIYIYIRELQQLDVALDNMKRPRLQRVRGHGPRLGGALSEFFSRGRGRPF